MLKRALTAAQMPPGSARPWRRDRGRALEPLKASLSSSIKWEQRQLLRKVKCGRCGTCLGWCPTCRGSPHTAATVVATVTMPRETADGALWTPQPTAGGCTNLVSASVLTPSHASAPGGGGGRESQLPCLAQYNKQLPRMAELNKGRRASDSSLCTLA